MANSLRAGTRVTARGETWEIASATVHADCESVRLSGASSSNAGTVRTLLLPFDRLHALPSAQPPIVMRPRRWAREVLSLLAVERPLGSCAAAAAARIDILPFQLEPALALSRHGCTRMLIADEVGLGKTIQAGLVLAELAAENAGLRAIVLTPAGLREQWREELCHRFGLAATVADARWLMTCARTLPPDVNPWTLPGIQIASVDLVKRPEVLRALEEVTWDLTIVDEAHACTAATARLAGAHAVASRSRRVILLTATPPDGDPVHMSALRAIGSCGSDDAPVEFRRTRAEVSGDATPRRSVMLQVRPSASERRMHRLLERYTSLVWREATTRGDHRARLAAIVLRKRALSSAWSLAASIRRRLELLALSPTNECGPAQLSLPLMDEDALDDATPDGVIGAAGLANAADERELLERVLRAAEQAARSESKLRFLLRFLRRAREPVIVFTEYRDTLVHLERAVAAGGHRVRLLHGGLSPRERDDMQRQFNEDGGVLLATDAASEGLNLHRRCRTVVHVELPWTPSRLAQRTGRVDRFGQRRRVHEVLLVARHTAERLVLAPLVRRAQAARRSGSRIGQLLDTLTESAIGAAVMEARPLAAAPVPGQAPRMVDVRREAGEEAMRIEWERRMVSGNPNRQGLPVCRTRRPGDSVTVMAAVRLEDFSGRIVHSSVVALVLQCEAARTVRSDAARKRLAADLCTTHRQLWQPHALAAANERLAHAAVRHRHAIDALVRRDSTIGTQPSTARTLVQGGLFDGRALREHQQRQLAATLLTEEAAHRTRAAAETRVLRQTVAVVAIR